MCQPGYFAITIVTKIVTRVAEDAVVVTVVVDVAANVDMDLTMEITMEVTMDESTVTPVLVVTIVASILVTNVTIPTIMDLVSLLGLLHLTPTVTLAHADMTRTVEADVDVTTMVTTIGGMDSVLPMRVKRKDPLSLIKTMTMLEETKDLVRMELMLESCKINNLNFIANVCHI